MEKKPNLVVRFGAQKMNNGILAILGVAFLCVCVAYLLPHHSLAPLFPSICSWISTMYMVGAIFLFFCLIFGLLTINSKDPVFIFSDEGIWIQYFGMIKWDEIAEMGEYSCVKGKEEPKAFGRVFKDPQEIAKRASWGGRSRLWGARMCKQQHILMPNLDTPTYEILRFTQQYMNCSSSL